MKVMSKISFIVGVLLAVGLSFLPGLNSFKTFLGLSIPTLSIIIVGLVVGLMNLKGTKTNNFLVTITALLVIGNAGLFITQGIGGLVGGMMINIIAFIVPSAVLIALKAVYEMATVH